MFAKEAANPSAVVKFRDRSAQPLRPRWCRHATAVVPATSHNGDSRKRTYHLFRTLTFN